MNSDMIIFTTDDEKVELNVKLENETVWLSRQQMALLFDRDVKTIGKHVNNVFKEGELDKKVVVANFATTTRHGAIEGKTQQREVEHHNLDVIISVGYRVKSQKGTQFRISATQRLKDDSPQDPYTRWKEWHDEHKEFLDNDTSWADVRDKNDFGRKAFWEE